ncbi:MAG: fimbria/pilus outer membrane usher protein [Kofleriaceae bacterium]
MRVLVAAAVMAGTAYADPLMPIQVSAQIGTTQTDLVVFTDGPHVWVPVAMLCAERLCPEPAMVRNDVGYVDLSAMREQLRFVFDENAGTLKIAIHADALPTTTLRMASLAPKNLEYLTAPSLFVNYSVDASYDLQRHATGLGFTEIGASDRDVLLYTTIIGSTPGNDVVRGLSNVTIDRRESLRSYTLGDSVVVGGLLGGGGVLGGIHVARDFSLDPYFVAQPTLTQTGVVSAPATVEVYRDGQLVRREVIPAGPFRVEDLTNAPSADTQVVVKDPFGATQMVMTAQILPPASALRPGLAQYDYSIGFARRAMAIESFDYGAPAALFVHRLGITNQLTIGGRIEGTYDGDDVRGSTGGSVTYTYNRLDIETSGAVSESSQGTSGAGSLDIGWRLPHATIAGLLRVVGKHYSTIDLGPNDDRATLETGGTIGWSPMSNVSVSTQLTYERMSAGSVRERAGVISGFNLYDMRATVSGGVSRLDNTTSFDAMFTLSKSLGQRTTATFGVTRDGGGPAAIASIAHAVDQNRGVGFDVEARLGEQSSGNAIVDAEHQYGRATATVDWFGSALRGDVGIAGGIVAIGGTVKPTRPVLGSFALVRVPGAANVQTYLENHPIGRTDGDGDLVIPELEAGYANRLRIDARDLPLDIATGALERLVGPPRRGGAIVEFAAAHTSIVSGTIVNKLDYSFGDIVIDGDQHAPIGHEARFEIDGISPGKHRARVELDDQHCGFEFVVPENQNTVELGRVTCSARLGMR